MKLILSLLLLFLFSISVGAQNLVKRNDSIKVYKSFQDSTFMELPWASGLNAAQLGHVDFNLDGILDLFLFEPNNEANYDTGDKIYPFINNGSAGEVNYKFEPKYRKNFPVLEDYAIMRDWNCDGKVDIFTWNLRQRVTVYKNVSDTSLKFKLEKRILSTDTSEIPRHPSYFHFGEILWAYFDMPSFEDIDGDGDLDILNTATTGHFLEYNKNMSMEYYGTCDSLTFKVKNTCWGKFFEDTGSVILNTCDVVNVPNPESSSGSGKEIDFRKDKSQRHSSDAILAIDLNGDGVKDLIAGDATRKVLYSFINGGKKDSSRIVSFTNAFPPVDPFKATIYGLPFYLDVNNDGVKDLIVSVAQDRLEDLHSIWYYKNIGSNSLPNFKLQTKSFLQEKMIDLGTQSKPVFFDYNQDSLMDIVVGNYGYFTQLGYQWYKSKYRSQLAIYENVGSKKEPVYKLVDTNFARLDTLNLNLSANIPAWAYHPTFGDLDNDGDQDMILGDHRGKIHYFQNIPSNGKAEFHLVSAELQNIDVGDFSTPQLFDLDDDGKLDLIVGETDGNLNYFRNTTTSALSFVLEDNNLGKVNVTDSWDFVGYSTPFFFKDSVGTVKLLSGSKPGHIRYYDSIIIGDTISNKFRKVENSYQDLWDGIFSTIHGADIDDDGQIDFILGNQSGGLALYTSEDSIYIPGVEEVGNKNIIGRVLYPNPAKNEVTLKIKCQCSDQFKYSVFDILGNLKDELFDDADITIQLNNYESGLYLIRAENKNRSIIVIERFIKME